MFPLDSKFDAIAALSAGAHGEAVMRLDGLAERVAGLVRRLEKFSFPLVAQAAAGLLIRPENHPATARIEAIIHLAAMSCRGRRAPTLAVLREWLNEIILHDRLAETEDPVEDVFVSNVATWFGNARLLEGGWCDNDYYVQACLEALTILKDRPWAAQAQTNVVALLRIGEAVIARAGVPRYTLSKAAPRRALTVSSSIVDAARSQITFTVRDILDLGFMPHELNPFLFTSELAVALHSETIGHTSLERRPLVSTGGEIIVALPTAIGAAVRRFIIEKAEEAGELDNLQVAIDEAQLQDVFHLGCSAWNIDILEDPQPVGVTGAADFVGRFDDGAYAHVLFVPDCLAACAHKGLQGVNTLPGIIDQRIERRTAEIAGRADYRRGMTLLVHGGVGRGFSAGFGEAPPGWQRLALSTPDFMRLGWDAELNALLAWKLLEQEDALRARGITISNINGFPNLYAYARHQEFELVPDEMERGFIGLATDFLTPLRHRLRVGLDRHLALGPGGGHWIEVQRETTSAFFAESESLPIFFSPGHIATGILLSCVETAARPWWVECRETRDNTRHRAIVLQLWKMTRNWLVPLASILEDQLGSIPSGPVSFRLSFDDLSGYDESRSFDVAQPVGPHVKLLEGAVVIESSLDYLLTFAHPRNFGDRLMVAALAQGAYLLAGQVADDATLEALVARVVKSDEARFFHTIPTRSLRDMVYATVSLPHPRLLTPEDKAWSRYGLAKDAGWSGPPGPVPEDRVGLLLNDAVDALWKRIKARLSTLDRASVIQRALLNHEAVDYDRATWRMTASALLALYRDTDDVLRAANEREGQRGLAGLACRVIAEMALCTSPLYGGNVCTGADIDELVARIGTLLECASQSDARWHGMAAHPLVVNPNGSLHFDQSFVIELQQPYMAAHGERVFRAAAADYGDAFDVAEARTGDVNAPFDDAFAEEFGVALAGYYEFAVGLTREALDQRRSHLLLPKNGVLSRLGDVGARDPERTFAALTLMPRPRWDEPKPKGATARDWYPWRFNRRLSLTRRPLVQVSTDANPDVLIVPTLLDANVRYLCEAVDGRLPVELFDSPGMRSWIGSAVDRNGHAFNEIVAGRLRELGWTTKTELKMTVLGGGVELGDVDVLAWRREQGLIHAIECKRLLFARTISEIGERLNEYASVAQGGERTPIQKHLDRMAFLNANPVALTNYTGVPTDRLEVRSALVTDYLVPMQFSARAKTFVDVVADIAVIDKCFK